MMLNAFVQTSDGLLVVALDVSQRTGGRAGLGGLELFEEVGEGLQGVDRGVGGGALGQFTDRGKRHARAFSNLLLSEAGRLYGVANAIVNWGGRHGHAL